MYIHMNIDFIYFYLSDEYENILIDIRFHLFRIFQSLSFSLMVEETRTVSLDRRAALRHSTARRHATQKCIAFLLPTIYNVQLPSIAHFYGLFNEIRRFIEGNAFDMCLS